MRVHASALGQVVAASFRVLLALLRYGTVNTKQAVLEQIREVDTLRSLICLAAEITEERWYPANVGANLLLIVQDLCAVPLNLMSETPERVILYDMVKMMLQSCLNMLEPKLSRVMEEGKLFGGKVRPMSHLEEGLMRQVVFTAAVMCESIGHISFADSPEITRAACELSLQCLLPLTIIRPMIKYLYYDLLLSYAVWEEREVAAAVTHHKETAAFREDTTNELTRLLAEHLCLNEDTRWDLLETFSR